MKKITKKEMKSGPEKQVFYDPTRYRWFFSKMSILIIALVLSLSFGLVAYNTFGQSQLPIKNPISNNLISKQQARPYALQQTSFTKTTPQATEALKNQVSITNSQPKKTEIDLADPKQTVFSYLVNWDDSSFESLKNNIGSMDMLVPEWLHLSDNQGNIAIDDPANQKKVAEYIADTRPELKIMPLVNNFNSTAMGWDSKVVSEMLANQTSRRNNIEKILDYVARNNFAGISLDYEAIPDQSRPAFTLFIKEIYQTFHPQGLLVSVNLPLDDQDFDFAAISESADFVILMAYDQNTPYGANPPGPIAGQKWVADSLKIKTGQIPVEKIVLSLGNYGYDWPDANFNASQGKDWTFAQIMDLVREKQLKISMDADSLNPRFDYNDENGNPRHVWLLDSITTYNQARMANSLGIFSFALWRLGSEDPTVWQVFPNLLKSPKEIGQVLSKIDFRDSIQSLGEGEVLKAIDDPAPGKRRITIDSSKNLVVEESYESFPNPFIVQRWGAAEKKLAITFDDGPDANYTSRILDILDKNNARATFFIIGANAAKNQDIIKRMDEEGHEIGSHTFSHPDISKVSENQLVFELNLVENMLESVIKKGTLLFRPPYAEDVEPETPDQIGPLLELSNMGYYTVAMHIDPLDWSQPGAKQIVDRVVQDLDSRHGNILLLHDSGGNREQTIRALPTIIAEARKRGYELVTVSQLMGLDKSAVMPDISPNERLESDFSWIAFIFSDFSMNFMKNFFIVGILLGLVRFAFIAILAIIQKILASGRKRVPENPAWQPKVTVVIPAYNEEKVVIRTVQSILDSDYQNLCVIAVDDGSTDQTYKVLLDNFSNNERVSVLTQENSGKSEALNLGISYANSEIVVTLDADTLFQKDTVSELAAHFENPKIGAVAGNTKVGNRINILTKWQALEYITSQNLDRRAFDLINGITVVPGSIGAWRKKAVLEAGGFQSRTLAEDADLTMFIIRKGYKVIYEEKAIAWTEAPDTIRNFIKQRFRWMYGTFQSAWLHKKSWFENGTGLLGIVAIPNIFIFQVIFPLLSPLVDIALTISLLWISWQKYHHPLDFNAMHSLEKVFIFYALFLVVDFLTSAVAFMLERKEDWKLLFWIFPQRFFYRQLMYWVAIKVFIAVLKGKLIGWGKFERKATVQLQPQTQEAAADNE